MYTSGNTLNTNSSSSNSNNNNSSSSSSGKILSDVRDLEKLISELSFENDMKREELRMSQNTPYHSRSDSKPFSYFSSRRTGGGGGGPSSSLAGVDEPGLVSPGLIRKTMTRTSTISSSPPSSPLPSSSSFSTQIPILSYSPPKVRYIPIELEKPRGEASVTNNHSFSSTADPSWLDRKLEELRERKECRESNGKSSSGVGLPQYNGGHTLLTRQKSDCSYDRLQRRTEQPSPDAIDARSLQQKLLAASLDAGSSRPITPSFPPGTPYNNRSRANTRAPSPCGTYNSSQRRGSGGSLASSSEVSGEESAHQVKLVKDNFNYWYKPTISREEAISLLKPRPAGTFVVRDSNSFPGAYGLALKVSTPPPVKINCNGKTTSDPSDELVRHFLIEHTSKGVILKGYSKEPVFASLSSLVYQHSLTALALPTKLVLPQHDLTQDGTPAASVRKLYDGGAACDVTYLFTAETASLTGAVAIEKAISAFLELNEQDSQSTSHRSAVVQVYFKVTTQGVTLTDNARKLFFRKHYNISTIGYCGLDPHHRVYDESRPASKIFAFVAKKHGSRTNNQCHVFAALDPEQPAVAIVNFVNKVMQISNPKRADIV